ncbi:MAG: MFS transporter [Promethearchaeota archaeon]
MDKNYEENNLENIGNEANMDLIKDLDVENDNSKRKKRDKASNKSFKEKLNIVIPVLLFLPLLLFISGDGGIFLANEVLIIVDFRLNEFALIGAIVGLGQIIRAVSTMVFGYIADKYKRKWALISGGLIWAFGMFICGIAPSPYWLLFGRSIASLGAGSSAPLSISLLSDIFPSKERGKSFAWWGLATTFGGLAGGSIALSFNRINYDFTNETISLQERIQYITEHYANNPDPAISSLISYWRYPFYLMAIIGFITSILILLVKEPKRGIAEEELHDILIDDNIDYSKNYTIKLSDLKIIYKRKSNFWLIINFVDTIFSGLLLGFIFVWILELGIKIDNITSQLPLLVPFLLIVIVFILWGQFWFAKKGDDMVKKGDYSGRVKVAIFCGIAHIPFLIAAVLFYPDLATFTFFKGRLDLSNNVPMFIFIFIIMALILGLGLGIEFGVGPAWYASMIDVNLPEHRGSMIAAASFMDAIGRGLGAWIGALIIDWFKGPMGSIKPVSDTIAFTTLTFGILSGVLWLPILKYAKHDFKEVHDIIEERAKRLEQLKKEMELKKKNNKIN